VRRSADGWPTAHLLDLTALLQKVWLLNEGSRTEAPALATTDVRVVSARAFAANLEFVVEYMTDDAANGRTRPESVHISLVQLPAVPLLGRVSDDRVGLLRRGNFVILPPQVSFIWRIPI
jgi:hypothetical protein